MVSLFKRMTLLVCTLAVASCQSAYFASEFHMDYDLEAELSKADRLNVSSFRLAASAEPRSDSFEMAKVRHSLHRALLEHGLSEAGSEAAADLIIFYDTLYWTSQETGTLALPTTTSTVGRVGGVDYSSTAWGTSFIPYSRAISGRSIWLYALRSTGGNTQVMWKGYIGCEDHYFDREDLRDLYFAHLVEMLLSGQTWLL